MRKNLSENELDILSKFISKRLFAPRSQKKNTVFLCGADVNDPNTTRAKMAALFEKYPKYELLYPEDLFDDLLSGQGQHSLLSLENILAESVDAIILVPESPGSFAELGAFSNNEMLAKKMLVIANRKYKKQKSFINYGPFRLIRDSKTGKVMNINYSDLTNSNEMHKIYRNINTHVLNIKRSHPVVRTVANILETENFILPSIYLMDETSNTSLYKLVKTATGLSKNLCEIATKSAIGRLISKRFITRNADGYLVTPSGVRHVKENYNTNHLDEARFEILNAQNRRNARLNCVTS